MPINKISAQVNLPAPTFSVSMPAGSVFMLPAGQGVLGSFGALMSPQLGSGNVLSGQYIVELGVYTNIQMFDYGLQYWRNVQVDIFGGIIPISSDGTNFRVINSTGCPVGAVITAAGSGGVNGFYGFNASGGPINAQGVSVPPGAAMTIQNGVITSGNTVFTITPVTTTGSSWNAIIGGGINTTISFAGTVYQNQAFGGTGLASVGSGGTLYTKPPLILFSPPPNQGSQPYILPTAVCTISGGAVNSVTVVNQGAGLLGLPQITVIPQPGDTTGAGAVLGWLVGNSGQVGSGTLMAMWPVFPGTPGTAPTTFTFGGTGNPAPTVTAIMNFVVTSITNTTPGSGYTAAYGLWQGGVAAVGVSAANTNPAYDKGISVPVFPPISVAATTGVTTLAGPFGGVNIQVAPTLAFGTQLAAGTVTTVAVQTPVVGGASDTLWLTSL
jgi:hypothetical protein